ncbi:MAG: hypothetical protein MOIL_01669 [Candidatus Methanolliviera sp. GoM_oil]|nr:MAG: hypothetical protein MOIL_01669 [Candidatus Methanolliviera sp. GoM_oil]
MRILKKVLKFLSINGIESRELIEKLKKYISGETEHFISAYLGRGFQEFSIQKLEIVRDLD